VDAQSNPEKYVNPVTGELYNRFAQQSDKFRAINELYDLRHNAPVTSAGFSVDPVSGVQTQVGGRAIDRARPVYNSLDKSDPINIEKNTWSLNRAFNSLRSDPDNNAYTNQELLDAIKEPAMQKKILGQVNPAYDENIGAKMAAGEGYINQKGVWTTGSRGENYIRDYNFRYKKSKPIAQKPVSKIQAIYTPKKSVSLSKTQKTAISEMFGKQITDKLSKKSVVKKKTVKSKSIVEELFGR
jgi:hypothetical protein